MSALNNETAVKTQYASSANLSTRISIHAKYSTNKQGFGNWIAAHFVNAQGMSANKAMTFFGQEKVEYNAKLCLMNMAVHGLTGVIKSGDEANTFYHDAHNLAGCCDYVMAIIWSSDQSTQDVHDEAHNLLAA